MFIFVFPSQLEYKYHYDECICLLHSLIYSKCLDQYLTNTLDTQ